MKWTCYPPLYSWAQELDDAQHAQRITIQCDSIHHCRNGQGRQFEAVWVFPLFTGRDCRASLWPGAWSEWPCVLKWSAAVVRQAARRLQKENLKFAGAGFSSSFISAWRLWLSGYVYCSAPGKAKNACTAPSKEDETGRDLLGLDDVILFENLLDILDAHIFLTSTPVKPVL